METGSLTLVSAGAASVWRTEGPIAFSHLYVDPARLQSVRDDLCGRHQVSAELVDRVGCRDPLLEPLFVRMLGILETESHPSTLLLDLLLDRFMLGLALRHVSGPIGKGDRRVTLAPSRLRRALDFIEANLGVDITLSDLARAAGTSSSHFSHAFHAATGIPPYRYLVLRRIEYARVLLMTNSQSVEEVSAACGFRSRRQLACMFKSIVGIGPKQFMMSHRNSRGNPNGDAARRRR
ncbi:MAG: AraC family transcriptional regulator [Caldimonas sp.]